MIKIALIGYGKMGKLVEQAALSRGHLITGILNSASPKISLSNKDIADADICIDFTHPSCVMENLTNLAALKKSVIMGTTGWYDQFEKVEKIVKNAKIGFLHAPNFSLGMALFHKLLIKAATLIEPFDAYDVSGLEIHHSQKADNPSGTALALSKSLNTHFKRKKEGVQFSSIRVGSVPGTHSIIFDSNADTITLTHSARNREGFAEGAVLAAEWLYGKEGMFTLDDMLATKHSSDEYRLEAL